MLLKKWRPNPINTILPLAISTNNTSVCTVRNTTQKTVLQVWKTRGAYRVTGVYEVCTTAYPSRVYIRRGPICHYKCG